MKYILCKKRCTKIQLVINFGSSTKLKQPVMHFSNNYISDMTTLIFRQVQASLPRSRFCHATLPPKNFLFLLKERCVTSKKRLRGRRGSGFRVFRWGLSRASCVFTLLKAYFYFAGETLFIISTIDRYINHLLKKKLLAVRRLNCVYNIQVIVKMDLKNYNNKNVQI